MILSSILDTVQTLHCIRAQSRVCNTFAKVPFKMSVANVGRMQGKVAIITGGTRGIGEGCVRVFVEQGATVVFCSPKQEEDEGRRLEKELNSVRPMCTLFIVCDVKDEAQIQALVKATVDNFGRIDCLLNNAGWHPPIKTIDEFTAEEFTDLFNINVLGCFLTAKYSLPYIRQTKGSVINIASMVASFGQYGGITYVATKGAVLAMTKAMAIDEAKYGVRVNSVSPSNVATPLFRSLLDPVTGEQQLEQAAKMHWMDRLGTPEEVGKACLFLATEATFSTGVDFFVAGGADLGYGNRMKW